MFNFHVFNTNKYLLFPITSVAKYEQSIVSFGKLFINFTPKKKIVLKRHLRNKVRRLNLSTE